MTSYEYILCLASINDLYFSFNKLRMFNSGVLLSIFFIFVFLCKSILIVLNLCLLLILFITLTLISFFNLNLFKFDFGLVKGTLLSVLNFIVLFLGIVLDEYCK